MVKSDLRKLRKWVFSSSIIFSNWCTNSMITIFTPPTMSYWWQFSISCGPSGKDKSCGLIKFYIHFISSSYMSNWSTLFHWFLLVATPSYQSVVVVPNPTRWEFSPQNNIMPLRKWRKEDRQKRNHWENMVASNPCCVCFSYLQHWNHEGWSYKNVARF